MNKKRIHLVTPLIMLGMLTVVLAALAFAEKMQEDGHLPERNDRGCGEILSMIAITGLTGPLIPIFRAGSGNAKQHTGHTTHLSPMGMRSPSVF